MNWKLLAWGLTAGVVLGVGLIVWPPTGPSLAIEIQQRGGKVQLARDETLLVRVMLEGPQFGDADATKLAQVSSIQSVSFENSSITREALRRLLPLSELRSLNLNRTHLVPESLDDIARFTALQQLHLAGCLWFRDDDLQRLEPLQQLEELILSETTIGAVGVEHLRQLPSLRVLKLNRCHSIQDDAIETLGRFSKLEVLDLTSSEISSRGAAQLRRELPNTRIILPASSLRDLRHLSSRVTFGGEGHGAVTSLSVAPGTQILPGDLGCLNHLTDVASINFDGSNITDEMLMELGARPALRSMSLRNTPITDDGLRVLAGCPNLTFLILYGTRIEGPGLRHLAHLTKLQILFVQAKSEDDLLDVLPQLTLLERMELHAPITDAGLLRLTSMPTLTVLDIYDARIAGSGLAGLTCAPNLTYLFLSELPLQDDAFVEGIAQLKSLLTVQLHRTGVTREGCERLRKLRPKLNIQWYDPGSSEWVKIE